MISQIYVIINGTDTIIFSLVRGNLQGHMPARTDNFPVPFTKTVYLKVSNVIYFVFPQTHLLNPTLIDLVLQFYIATASWLNQLALAGDNFEEMTSFKEVEIPLPAEVSKNYLVHAFCTYSYFVCFFVSFFIRLGYFLIVDIFWWTIH